MTLNCSKCGGKLEKPRFRDTPNAICLKCLGRTKRETAKKHDLVHKKSQNRRFE